MQTLYEQAKLYQSFGWSILPIKYRGKKPLVQWSQYQSRRPTDVEISTWFNHNQSMNIGLVTGEVSGVVVLDVDDRAAVKGKELPITPCVQTGRGGFHYYYQWPGHRIKNFVNEINGLDFRGDGGEVVLPYSVHENGNIYEWVIPIDTPLATMPAWLLGLFECTSKIPVTVADEEPVTQGQRNAIMTSLAGSMRYRSFCIEAISAALQIENKKRCIPPLPEWEVELIAHSVGRYEPGVINE